MVQNVLFEVKLSCAYVFGCKIVQCISVIGLRVASVGLSDTRTQPTQLNLPKMLRTVSRGQRQSQTSLKPMAVLSRRRNKLLYVVKTGLQSYQLRKQSV